MEWLISANAKMYDHSSSFEHYSFIDWRQGNAKFQIGDTVYIYCTSPLMMVQYKCIIEQINLSSKEIRDDKNYWYDLAEYEKSLNGKFMRLRLVEQVSNERMKLHNLKNNGLNAAPQGPIKITKQLSEYLKLYFTDKYQSDYFPETIVSEDVVEYEGNYSSVKVNKYERSSKARENAVKHHGLNCKICNFKLEDLYGEIASGFIHIHHLVPLNKIGKNYQINYKNDLIPVCPNCHAMLHRKINGNEPSVSELKQLLKKTIFPKHE